MPDIILGHTPCGEPSLETGTHLVAIQFRKTFNRFQRFVLAVYDETVTPSSITSGTEPRRNAITCVPHAIASIITKPNGLAGGCLHLQLFVRRRNAGARIKRAGCVGPQGLKKKCTAKST
jgi:hypothetical protein